MTIQTIEAQRLYQQVAGQIGELIQRGTFRPGDRLPPERDLARKLGVSRPVVREAMIALEIAGLVEVRTGSGTYVREAAAGAGPAPAGVQLQDAGPSPFDLISARKLLEGEVAFAAALSARPSDLDAVAAALDMMAQAIAEGRNTQPADRLFHVRIAEATGNSVLVAVVDGLWGQMFAPVFDALGRRTGLPENQRTTMIDHGRILEALRRRDPAEAKRAMRAHLIQVEEVLLRED